MRGASGNGGGFRKRGVLGGDSRTFIGKGEDYGAKFSWSKKNEVYWLKLCSFTTKCFPLAFDCLLLAVFYRRSTLIFGIYSQATKRNCQ